MIHVGVDLIYPTVEEVMLSALKELENNKRKIARPGPKDDVESIRVSMSLHSRTIQSKLFVHYLIL